MVFSDTKINVVTTSLPVFLIAIAVADSIHFMSVFYKHIELKITAEAAARRALDQLFSPLLLTTITTTIGFLALAVTDLTFAQELGIFVAIGVLLAFVFTIVLLPPLMVKMNAGKSHQRTIASPFLSKIDSIGGLASVFSLRRPKTLAFIWLILGSAGIYQAAKLEVSNSNVEAFHEGSQLRVEQAVVLEHFGGVYPVNLWFHSKEPRAFTQPEVIMGLEKISNYIEEKYTGEGTSFSIVDYLKRSNQVLNDNEFTLPKSMSDDLIGQYYFLYEGSSRRDILSVSDMNYENSRMLVYADTDNSKYWEDFIDDVGNYSNTVLPESIDTKFYGFGEYMVSSILEVIRMQVTSIMVALVLIVGLLIILFRSVVIGFAVSIPLILTMIVNFAIMVTFQIPLDIGTALVASIAFGIGVDYAIHYTSALKNDLRGVKFTVAGKDYRKALTKAFSQVARPIVVNSLSLSAGFLVLTVSKYELLSNMGVLIASTMIVCAFITLFLLPTIFLLLKPKSLFNDSNDV